LLGAFVAGFLVSIAGLNIIVALLGAMAFCMLTGMLVGKSAYRPLRASLPRLSPLISRLGVSIFFVYINGAIASPNARRYPEVIPSHSISFGSIEMSSLQIIILVLSPL
jgi:branched-chain amino acid transport system permease protein